MKEFGRTQAEKEVARLRQRNLTKSPVKENVKKFEEKTRNPTGESSRSQSPSVKNQRPNTLFSPTGSKSPGISSPMRSKSPGVQTHTRSKSPGVYSPSRSKSPGVTTPNRSKSPGIFSPGNNESPVFGSPRKSPGSDAYNRSKSPGSDAYNRGKSPGSDAYNRSKSPGSDAYNRSKSPGSSGYNRSKSPGYDSRNRSKSPGMNTFTRAKSPLSKTHPNQQSSPTRNKSPAEITQSPVPSPTKSPGMKSGGSKWNQGSNGWAKESPVVAEKITSVQTTPDYPMVGDNVDISWYFDNIEYVTDSKAHETNSQNVEDVWPGAENPRTKSPGSTGSRSKSPGARSYGAKSPGVESTGFTSPRNYSPGTKSSGAKSPGNSRQNEQRYRNYLNYNIAAWDDEEYDEEPKKADEFIQRLCDQVRNHVEYLCGMDFVNYKAVSYKVRAVGSQGIFYYVKVNVWQNYCLHLRIYSDKTELMAIPALQAILERAQPDNGNIEFF